MNIIEKILLLFFLLLLFSHYDPLRLVEHFLSFVVSWEIEEGEEEMTDLLSYFISKSKTKAHNEFDELMLLIDSDVNG